MKADNFTVIPFTTNNLDLYIMRNAIFDSLKEALPLMEGKMLDIGCGKMPYKNYILSSSKVNEYTGLDIENALIYDKEVQPDVTWDGISMPFVENSFDCAIGTEVLEHCKIPEVLLNEVSRVLRTGGKFFFTVPFLWNLHEVPNDEYRYTPFSLERHLVNCGFKILTIKATGGWHSSLAQMLGLWVRRSPISAKKRKYFSIILQPIIKILHKKDLKHSLVFKEGQMITGLYGVAEKI